MLIENALDCLGHKKDVIGRHKLFQQLSHTGVRTHPAACIDSEPRAVCSVFGDEAEVVDGCPHTIRRAAGKGDFVLSWQPKTDGIRQHKLGKRDHIGRYVERFVLADPSVRTRGDVAHRVTASPLS